LAEPLLPLPQPESRALASRIGAENFSRLQRERDIDSLLGHAAENEVPAWAPASQQCMYGGGNFNASKIDWSGIAYKREHSPLGSDDCAAARHRL
jgi:hypothetical protein